MWQTYNQIGDVEDETSLRVELLGNGVCVCVTEREGQGEIEGERERERECVCVCERECV